MKCNNCGHENNDTDDIQIKRELVIRYIIRFETISDSDLLLLGVKNRCHDGHIQIDVKGNSREHLIALDIKHKYVTTTREYSFNNEFI